MAACVPALHELAVGIGTAPYQVEPDCGHFIWVEQPGSVRQGLNSICG